MKRALKELFDDELRAADGLLARGEMADAFRHLERAHIIGQSDTAAHTQVHWRMLKFGLRRRDAREIVGQTLRIVGASTKTPVGIYPKGNTGGANVSPFKPMPIPAELQDSIERAERDQ